MNDLTPLGPRTGSVHFGSGPRYGSPQIIEFPGQRMGRDSDGNTYVYGKSKGARVIHRLEWQNRPRSVVDDLLLFIKTASGCKYEFTWTDHVGGTHLVHFPRERFSYKQTGPDAWQVSIGLEEQSELWLVDETGTALVDENGNTLTW